MTPAFLFSERNIRIIGVEHFEPKINDNFFPHLYIDQIKNLTIRIFLSSHGTTFKVSGDKVRFLKIKFPG